MKTSIFLIVLLLSLVNLNSHACPAPQSGNEYDNQISIKEESKSVYVVSIPHEGNLIEGEIYMKVIHLCMDTSNGSSPRSETPIEQKLGDGVIYGKFITFPKEKCEAYVSVTWNNVICSAVGLKKVDM